MRALPGRWLAGLALMAGLAAIVPGCRATDAAPDEFSVQVGTTDSEGASTTSAGPLGAGRTTANAGGDAQWIALGWTWHLGDVADREQEAARWLQERQARIEMHQRLRALTDAIEQAGIAQQVPVHDAGTVRTAGSPVGTEEQRASTSTESAKGAGSSPAPGSSHPGPLYDPGTPPSPAGESTWDILRGKLIGSSVALLLALIALITHLLEKKGQNP